MANNVLIVDDEADIRSLIGGILEDEGYEVRKACDAPTAWQMISEQIPDILVLDIWLQNSPMDGIDILRKVKESHPDIAVIMISGHGNIETAIECLKIGAYDFIEKPFQTDRLLITVQRALENARLHQENKELRSQKAHPDALIGGSPETKELQDLIQKISPTNSRILITGSQGTGKEVVARLIHQSSKRAERPFIVVNCATLEPQNFEKEVFGVEETHLGDKIIPGALEKAHNSTLFFDEIADMPLETQAKVVRILQDQKFERINGKQSVEMDVRFIAATNKNLDQQIRLGKFREDLFYRLNVIPIHVPDLQQHRDDIRLLAMHFMHQIAEKNGLKPLDFTENAFAAMEAYHWPGNIRQLRNLIEWLLIMSDKGKREGKVDTHDLPPEIAEQTPAVMMLDKGEEMMGLPLREARELFEKEYLASQIHKFGGNISRTASFIGMERSALHRKLKSLNISSNSNEKNTDLLKEVNQE